MCGEEQVNSRLNSVVECVTRNDEVACSIQAVGIVIFFLGLLSTAVDENGWSFSPCQV